MTNCDSEHDNMLFSMLTDCKTLPVFFDHIFGFLKRRTDFYTIAPEINSPIGLPPGLSEAIVKHGYTKYLEQNKVNTDILKPNENSNAMVTTGGVKNEHISLDVQKSKCKNSSEDPAKNYNGASYNNYSWTQTYNDVDITITIPKDVKTRDLQVEISSNSVLIKLKDGTIILNGEITHSFKHTDAIWSVDNHELVIHLDKSKEIWWNCFFITEPRLDVNKMECTKPLEDLSEDAQAKIHELQWNQEQKRLGLPTSDQLATLKTLKKAWSAEGCPFSEPFDPNSIILH